MMEQLECWTPWLTTDIPTAAHLVTSITAPTASYGPKFCFTHSEFRLLNSYSAGYMPMVPRMRSLLEAERAAGGDRRTTTFCLANGTNDPQVKFPWAQWSEEALRAGECNVRLITYL
jgi:hypothetical protein